MTPSHCQKPLLGGRILRGAVGVAFLAGIPFVPEFDLAWLGILALVVAGAIFLLAGILANPGCELTAPVNVFLPHDRRLHCFCPLFSPIDRLERALRRRLS